MPNCHLKWDAYRFYWQDGNAVCHWKIPRSLFIYNREKMSDIILSDIMFRLGT